MRRCFGCSHAELRASRRNRSTIMEVITIEIRTPERRLRQPENAAVCRWNGLALLGALPKPSLNWAAQRLDSQGPSGASHVPMTREHGACKLCFGCEVGVLVLREGAHSRTDRHVIIASPWLCLGSYTPAHLVAKFHISCLVLHGVLSMRPLSAVARSSVLCLWHLTARPGTSPLLCCRVLAGRVGQAARRRIYVSARDNVCVERPPPWAPGDHKNMLFESNSSGSRGNMWFSRLTYYRPSQEPAKHCADLPWPW